MSMKSTGVNSLCFNCIWAHFYNQLANDRTLYGEERWPMVPVSYDHNILEPADELTKHDICTLDESVSLLYYSC